MLLGQGQYTSIFIGGLFIFIFFGALISVLPYLFVYHVHVFPQKIALKIRFASYTRIVWKASLNYLSYLSNRSQVVQIGEAVSEKIVLEFGTPQGSCLSCMIFIIYTSDCEDWIDTGVLQCYAYDSFLTVRVRSCEELKQVLESEGLKVLKFFASNNLIANAEKSDLLIIRPSGTGISTQELKINLHGTSIPESPDARILGVEVSGDLFWKKHRIKLRKDLNYRLGQIIRQSKLLGTRELKMLGHGLMNSKISYCLSTYGMDSIRIRQTDSTNGEMKAIQTVQNKMARAILHLSSQTKIRSSEMFKKLGMLSVNQACIQDVLMQAWKAREFKIRPLCDFENGETSRKNMRSVSAGKVKTTYSCPRSFPCVARDLWNLSTDRFKRTNLITVAKEEARKLALTFPF